MKRPKRSLGFFFVLVLFLCLSIAVGLSIWNYIQDDTLEAIYPGFPIWLWYRIGRPVAAP